MPSNSCLGWCTGCKSLFKNRHQHKKYSPTCENLVHACAIGPSGFCTTPHIWAVQAPVFLPNVSHSYKNALGEMESIRVCPGFMVASICQICGKIGEVEHFAYRYIGSTYIDCVKFTAPRPVINVVSE